MVCLTFFTSLESLASQTEYEASAKAWRGHVFFTDPLAVYFIHSTFEDFDLDN